MRDEENAAQALTEFAQGPAIDAAETTARAFELAGERIANALEGAARTGEFSFSTLAESVTQDLARLAINELLIEPLQGLISGVGGGGNGGDGGIGSALGRALTVNMNVSGVTDPQSFQRSQGQITAGLARAVTRGQRLI